MEFIDYYAVLGVPKSATKEEIDSAYRRQARAYHPDVSKAKNAEEKFKQVNEAYEVLKDPAKRAHYDRYGSDWKEAERQAAAGGATSGGYRPRAGQPGAENVQFEFGDLGDLEGFSDFFQQLFGMRGGAGRPGTRTRRRTAAGSGPRRHARGSGFEGGDFTSGFEAAGVGSDQEAMLQLTLEEAAHGGPKEISLRDPRTGRSRTLAVRIPRGVRPGQRIRLAGQGDPGSGGAPSGSLYLRVDIEPHPLFTLRDDDLYTVLPVAPWAATLGGNSQLRTLDGTVRVKVPAGSSSGRHIRLAGKGFPRPLGGAGDLYATIRIVVPEHPTPEERELLEKLAAVTQFTPGAQHAPAANGDDRRSARAG